LARPCRNGNLVCMGKTETQISFARRCKALRALDGASQETFANRIGMDRSYYASIETGMRNVTLSNLSKIAKGFGVSLSELMEGVA
jgi:transcriptional regulator with XRE-family HTH domain